MTSVITPDGEETQTWYTRIANFIETVAQVFDDIAECIREFGQYFEDNFG